MKPLIKYDKVTLPPPDINQLNLMGQVGAPPEARGTPSNPLTQFDLATLTRFKQGTGEFYLGKFFIIKFFY